MNRPFWAGAYVGVLIATASIGQQFGGVAWVPFFIAFFPAVTVGAGFLYGLVFSTNVGSVDDAVSKGLEKRRDTEPEDSNDE